MIQKVSFSLYLQVLPKSCFIALFFFLRNLSLFICTTLTLLPINVNSHGAAGRSGGLKSPHQVAKPPRLHEINIGA